MHRRWTSAVTLAASAALLAGCGSAEPGASPDRTITAGFYPLAWVSERVAGDDWAVENLTTPGGDPHDQPIGLPQTAALEGAALVVISSGLQSSVDSTVDSVATGRILDAADHVDLLTWDEEATAHEEHSHEGHDHSDDESHEGHDHSGDEESHEGHDHGPEDPHFWHDPERMGLLADAVAEELSDLDPEGAAGYRERAEELVTELSALDDEFTQGLATCERNLVVVSHDAFGYLEGYGLEFAPIAGLSPDAEPTPAALGRLQNLIRDEGITTVFSERLASTKMADTLAADLGIDTAVLDPIEGLTDSNPEADYMSLMRDNLAALRKANGCS